VAKCGNLNADRSRAPPTQADNANTRLLCNTSCRTGHSPGDVPSQPIGSLMLPSSPTIPAIQPKPESTAGFS
jgi:hypothetical protein